MTAVYLIVTLFINGVPVPGEQVSGWHRMVMPDMATCLRAARRGNHYPPPLVGGFDDILFSCKEL